MLGGINGNNIMYPADITNTDSFGTYVINGHNLIAVKPLSDGTL